MLNERVQTQKQIYYINLLIEITEKKRSNGGDSKQIRRQLKPELGDG